jgi:hypothetical protein
MSMQTLVEFDADFPNDSEWDAAGNLQTPGGRAVITWISQSLRTNSLECSEVTQKSFYGWQCQVYCDGMKSQLVIQAGCTSMWLLICEPLPSPWRGLFGGTNSTSQQKILFALDSILKIDSRVSHIQWFSREEYEGGKHPRRRSVRP